MTIAVINAYAQPLLEGHLPDWVEPRWFATAEELFQLAPEAEIGWFDTLGMCSSEEAVRPAKALKWLNTIAAGVDSYPLDLLRERGVTFTNGSGIHAVAVAEYVVMGMLTIAKGWREVVRAQERHEWLADSSGKMELAGSNALIVGAGAIGGRLAHLLRPWDVAVTEVRRHPAEGALGADEWRARLGEFDWVILTVPSTPETVRLFGAAELAAMKPGASLLNFARGEVVDQEALIAALRAGTLGSAFLDVTEPEPLPPEHPLWSFDNVHISMHLSGRAQRQLFRLAADRFLDNLERYRRGEPVEPQVNLALGY